MEEKKKPKITRVQVLMIILLCLLAPVVFAAIKVNIESSLFKQEMERNGEFEYHNQPNNQFNAPIVYYRSDLERIVGVRLKETASSIEGITAKQYYSNGSETTEYDGLVFYIFDKEGYAYNAYNSVKSRMSSVTEDGGNYIRGWLPISDNELIANPPLYDMIYYINGNLLVVANLGVQDSYEEIHDEESEIQMIEYDRDAEAKRIIKLVTENL